jgi:hypothetical protein
LRYSYNQFVRIGAALLLFLSLVGCNRAVQSDDALRQAVIDHLAKGELNIGAMDVKLAKVDRKSDTEAEVVAAISAKGADPSAGMTIGYKLEQQNNRWVVVGRQGGTPGPHSMPPPDTANPHGGGGAAPGGSKMPSPEDLPPATKK